MQVILPDKSRHTLPQDPQDIREILLKFGCNPTSVIVIRNGIVVPEDFTAREDDEIRIISVSHGG
jgi:sulfur carrier protein ThiS